MPVQVSSPTRCRSTGAGRPAEDRRTMFSPRARREAARPLHARQAPFGGRDRRILQFIHDYMEAHGYAPTIREMASYMDSAPSTIFRHLRLLEQAGYLDHCKGKIRAIVLTDLGRQTLLPPVGGAGGGQP